MSMNLARWRREQQAISIENGKQRLAEFMAKKLLAGDTSVSLNDHLRLIAGDDDDFYRERYEVERLRQSGKRRKPMMRCKCGVSQRRIAPKDMGEAMLRKSGDWNWSLFTGWKCGACKWPPLEFRVPVAHLGGSTECSTAGDTG